MSKQLIEYEKTIIAAVKIDNRKYDEVSLSFEYFRKSENRQIYKIIADLIESGKEANDVSIYEEIEKRKLDIPLSYLISCDVVSTANITFYSDQIKDNAKRFVLKKMMETISGGLSNKDEVSEIVEKLEKHIESINIPEANTIKDMREYIMSTMSQIEERYKNGGMITGISTGFTYLDKMTNGFQDEDYIIIAARPSLGKTSLLVNFATNIALNGFIVGIFSSEMNINSLIERIIAIDAEVNLHSIRTGNVKQSDFSRLVNSVNKLYTKNIIVDDTPNIGWKNLKANARMMKRKGVQIMFIDYMSLLQYSDKSIPRHEQIAEMSRGTKQLARELKIPIVMISQVGRSSEGKTPTLADLRESGSIEQDADLVLFLHRKREETKTELIIAKHRNGPIGSFHLNFEKQYTKFTPYVEDQEKEEGYTLWPDRKV